MSCSFFRTHKIFLSHKILCLNFNKLTTRNFRIITQNLANHCDNKDKSTHRVKMEKIRDNFSLENYDCIGFDLGKKLLFKINFSLIKGRLHLYNNHFR